MMTEELTDCPKCGFDRALTHWSSDNLVNWVACPKCRSFFDHGVEDPGKQTEFFWGLVEEDTKYKREPICD